MRIARSLGCGFVVLLALWPLAGLKSHAGESGLATQPKLAAEAQQRLSALATRYVDEGRVAGLHLMVNRGGQLVFETMVGQRSMADNRPLSEDDLYRMYSMTKPITAVAIMQLYERGHFRLADPITRWLPELAGLRVRNLDGTLTRLDTPITMRHLLTHTAGFSYGFDLSDPLDEAYRAADLWGAADLDEWVRRLATLPLKFQPGARWHYSIASDLAGLLVQRMSGQSLAVYLQQAIFEPLKMTDTFFEVPTPQRSRLLDNHFWNKTAGAVERVFGTVPALGLNAETDA
ncbi:MAG: beta-lactamase family protein, partial [Gammaproteobacteria bacterium]|nr:beta-lactamase family protein [Gammaproteobacteria bacterium]